MSRRLSIEVACVVALVSGCSSMPWYKPMPAAEDAAGTAVPATPTPTKGGQAAPAPTPAPAAAGAAVGPAGPPSAKATADFNRAVNFMRSGNATEAELEF